MKNILSFINLENLKNNIKNISVRFPVSVLLVIIVTTLFILTVHIDFLELTKTNIYRVIFSLIVTFFFSVSVYISTESLNLENLKKNAFQIIPILFGIFFYISFKTTIDDFENTVFFILSLSGILSYLFFAPYIKKIIDKNIEQNTYYTYFYKISVVFLTAIILGFVLFVLGFIAINTVFTLFDITGIYNEKLIGDWASIALAFITPLFALTQIPNKENYNENKFSENAFFSFLTKYIAIPFIYVYFIILYAYSIKVLSHFSDWPKGEVSWMVIGFSSFGYLIYIFSYIFESTNKFISTFRKGFPYVVVPQLFMLFYAIYLRINQYDITVNRYFVVIFGLWLAVLSVYFIFSKRKNLSTIPSVLTIFIIIISIGPWSVYNLPESRQYNRLVVNLESAGILKDGKIIPLQNYSDINADLSKNIYSGVEYVCQFNNCEKIKALFPDQYNSLVDEERKNFEKRKVDDLKYFENDPVNIKLVEERVFTGPSRWQIPSYINDKIKVRYYFDDAKNQESINLFVNKDIFPINIEGYSKMYSLNSNIGNTESNYGNVDLLLNKIDIIGNNRVVVDTIDIKDITTQIVNKYKDSSINNPDLKSEDLTFIVGNYKIIFTNLSIKNPDYTGELKYNNNYANGYILIK
ncbi:MAG: DUF4153 domain-containing protein [Candidatus Gracilibacteria bacterium]|nr:DUF4153 domain-containing protein [Candidatus Gracilibacteria bacterium]